MNMKWISIVCLALVFLPAVYSLTMQVEPKVQECFSEELARHRQVKFNWQVIRGGLLDVKVVVKYEGVETNPTSDILFEKLYFEKDDAPGAHEFITKRDGVYSFCFDNTMSRFTAKVVRFDIILHDKWGVPEADDDEADPTEILEPMEISARKISEELEILTVHQQYMRSRELRHVWTQTSTNSRIFWFTILECIALLSISFAQVYYIKRFFRTPKSFI